MESVSLEFRATPLEAEQLSQWSIAQLETGHHRVTVRRTADGVRNCAGLHADLLRTAHSLTLRVRESAPEGGEGPAGEPCGYTAVVDAIPAGQYVFRVVHSGFGGGTGAQEVMNQPLVIQ